MKDQFQKALLRLKGEAEKLYSANKNAVIITSVATLVLGAIYLFSQSRDRETHVYHRENNINIKGGRILEGDKSVYKLKGQVLSKKVSKIETGQRLILEQVNGLGKMVKELQEFRNAEKVKKLPNDAKNQAKDGQTNQEPKPNGVTLSPSPSGLKVGRVDSVRVSQSSPNRSTLGSAKKRSFRRRGGGGGPAVISFPVQAKERIKGMTVKLPPGAFVKAKLLTGVEASEARAVPVLMQADYAFVGPNKTRVDLSGCFFLAKSKGNLSIERVEAQITTLSCVSKSGRMFERSVNGFITDAKDNSFAVMGSVNSKQDRVAAMAFLSSVVEGVGKAIQQAQTTNQTNAVGGTSSMITGSQAKYMAAGGVSNAAGLVTQWYLKHAQNLLPTINIGSGQDVWVVMQNSVDLPNWYFKKVKAKGGSKGHYSYMSGLLN